MTLFLLKVQTTSPGPLAGSLLLLRRLQMNLNRCHFFCQSARAEILKLTKATSTLVAFHCRPSFLSSFLFTCRYPSVSVSSRVIRVVTERHITNNWNHFTGFCVCDESSLTGESMPVQKYAAIISQDGYEPQGRGYRHTLFSGATVLQAGTCPSDEIIGVVSATGRI